MVEYDAVPCCFTACPVRAAMAWALYWPRDVGVGAHGGPVADDVHVARLGGGLFELASVDRTDTRVSVGRDASGSFVEWAELLVLVGDLVGGTTRGGGRGLDSIWWGRWSVGVSR